MQKQVDITQAQIDKTKTHIDGSGHYEVMMIADREDYQRAFGLLMLVVGLVMLGLAIPYGVATARLIDVAKTFRSD
jgi:hypothetical protein